MTKHKIVALFLLQLEKQLERKSKVIAILLLPQPFESLKGMLPTGSISIAVSYISVADTKRAILE